MFLVQIMAWHECVRQDKKKKSAIRIIFDQIGSVCFFYESHEGKLSINLNGEGIHERKKITSLLMATRSHCLILYRSS